MKHLLITIEYPPFKGGVANYYENLINYWPKESEVFVLNNNGGELVKNSWPVLKWLPGLIAVYKNVVRHKIDHLLVGHILPLGTIAFLIAKIKNIKYSIFLHGMDFDYALKSRRKALLTGKILKNCYKIICVNSYVAGRVEAVFPEMKYKVEVVNPGVSGQLAINNDQLSIREKYCLDNKIVLLTVARLVKRKGVDYVLDCLPEVIKEIPNVYYAIVGRGEERDNYELKIKDLKLENYARVITDADDDERNAWYRECDIFIMPSRNIDGDYEGFGIVYLEANLAGKPVIAGDSGGVRDAIVDGLNGLLVDPESRAEITSAIVKLAGDKELRERLGRQGRERVVGEFGWEGQVAKIVKLFNC